MTSLARGVFAASPGVWMAEGNAVGNCLADYPYQSADAIVFRLVPGLGQGCFCNKFGERLSFKRFGLEAVLWSPRSPGPALLRSLAPRFPGPVVSGCCAPLVLRFVGPVLLKGSKNYLEQNTKQKTTKQAQSIDTCPKDH